MKSILIFIVFFISLHPAHARTDASGNNTWISIGTPTFAHVGTNGEFYLNGSDQGSCGGVVPTYFQLDMNDPHFKEFYSWLLTMSALKNPIDCIVASGCGSTYVSVKYCRGPLQ